jgi:hypothetical protein
MKVIQYRAEISLQATCIQPGEIAYPIAHFAKVMILATMSYPRDENRKHSVPGSIARVQFFASSRRERTDATCRDSKRDTSNFSECQSSVYKMSMMD